MMMNVVITGSTKGIGLGMAHEFVRLGHNVVVSSRRAAAVEKAEQELNGVNDGHASGIAADVADIADVRALWEHAINRFGSVDIWINNAGVTNRKLNLDQIPDEQLVMVSQTNLLGLLNCCKVALGGMLQQGSGKIFNMEGFGSDGIIKPGMSAYGASKRALFYLTKALVSEYKDTPLIIGYMSPGIVVTDLLTKDLNDSESEEFKNRIGLFNIVADRVETVAPFLVQGALAASKSGAAIRWMSIWKLLGRFIQKPFVKRDVMSPVGSNS
jgi:NAD(P)-dependent dehydrogenase (short-subunit alcohol dehydrogenase family)